MTPVEQRIPHDPMNGMYGDCMRACVASILDLEIEEVPHFYASGDQDTFDDELYAFLKSKGLAELNIKWRDMFKEQYIFRGVTGIYHIITGRTKDGAWHAVVGMDGEVVFDPDPDTHEPIVPVYYSFFITYPRG